MNEFLHSPLWIYEDEIVTEGVSIIENDSILQALCENAAGMFADYYEFDSHDQSCWFNHEKEKAEKEAMLNLIALIIARLNEINDGSFEIEDLETERLKEL
ncbi:MAG: RNA helicase [Subdoligranulum sp.]|nr:RNA helicase [Subdoligranulum sp.]